LPRLNRHLSTILAVHPISPDCRYECALFVTKTDAALLVDLHLRLILEAVPDSLAQDASRPWELQQGLSDNLDWDGVTSKRVNPIFRFLSISCLESMAGQHKTDLQRIDGVFTGTW